MTPLRSRVQFIDFIKSLLFRYCFHCWSIRDIISLLFVVVPWQTSPLNQIQVIFNTLIEGDLTTLNTLRMFTSGQRNFASSTTSSTTLKTMIVFNDKIKVNKFDIYKGERNELDDWLIQMKLYFAFNFVSKNQKTLFAFTYLRERAQHWFKSQVRLYMKNEKDIEDKIFI